MERFPAVTKRKGDKNREERKRLDMLYPDTGLQDYNVGSYAAPDPVTTYSITYSEEYDEPILSQSVPRKGIPISTLDTSINSSLIPLDTDFAKCESTQSRKKGPRKLSYQERKQRAFVVYGRATHRPQEEFKLYMQFRRKVNYTIHDQSSSSSELQQSHWSDAFLIPNKPLCIGEAKLVMVNDKEAFDSMMSTLWSELVISLDLEGHEDRCFYGMTALLQISTSSTDFLINPFSLCEEISTEFRDYLEDIEGLVIMHGSSNDLLWLLRDFQIKIGTLFDIQDYYYVETGRFQAGLVEVAHYYTQSDLKTTHKDICQVADWTNQPLHKDLVQYARQDARLLLEIFEVIKSKDPKGILVPTTLQESRKRMKVHYKPKTYPTCGSQLGALRKRPVLPSKNEILLFILWEWRRIISCEFDDGPEYVIPFQKLVQLAVKCPSNVNEIELILRPMAESTKRSISSLLCVIQDGQPYLDKMKMIPCDICKKIGHVAVLCYRKGSQQDVKDWMKSHPQHKRAQNRRRRLNKKGNERTRKQEALCKMPE